MLLWWNLQTFISFLEKSIDDIQENIFRRASRRIVKELLPAIDNLERAIKLEDDNLTDELSKFLSGVKMIYCSTIASLEKYGVKFFSTNDLKKEGIVLCINEEEKVTIITDE